MTVNNLSSGESQSAGNIKKPYEKPTFRYEQVFVTSALSCSKTGSEGQCHSNGGINSAS
jgi:hypothetical protein